MIHYTCDRCKTEIDSELDLRFTVRMEFEPAISAEASPFCDDVDNLHSLEAFLASADVSEDGTMADEFQVTRQYDLCNTCYQHYTRNPFGSPLKMPLGFSEN